jgi:glycosyltransferase involved in cell wall biosynthesis
MNEPVSVILPVQNEQESLDELHARLTIALKSVGTDYEIIFVDDGSTDGSWETLKGLAEGDGRVRLIRLRRNFGQTAALAAGFQHARHPVLVTLDADLQNDPADVPQLLAALDGGADIVAGWRRRRRDAWLTRRVPSQIANALIRLVTGVRLHDFGCTLRAYRRAILNDVSLHGEMHRFLPVLAAWVGGRIAEIEVVHHPRVHGRSKYGLWRTYKVVVDLITLKFIANFQTRPNYVFASFALLNLALGALSLAIITYRIFVLHRLEATPVVFFMVIFFLTGVLSLFIGFLAEIVIRGFLETQRKPIFYVRETVGFPPSGGG